MNKTAKSALLWIILLVVVVGTIWGIVRLAGSQKTGTEPAPSVGALAPVTGTDWVKDNKDAKVTILEYADFQCPACGYYYQLFKPLDKDYGTRVRYVFRNFPLSQHKNSDIAAVAAGAAGKQGKFWEMHDMIFDNQNKWSDMSTADARKTFVQYAASLKLDAAKFQQDLDAKDVADKITNDLQGGLSAGVTSTPSFFLNGKYIQPNTYDEFRSLIDQVLKP